LHAPWVEANIVQVGDKAKFYWCAGAGLMGVIVTVLFIPEITQLDLREGDKRWEILKAGKHRTSWGTLSR